MPRDKAYGTEHVRRRAHLLKSTPAGTPCEICGRPMYPGSEPLDLGHRSQADKRAGRPGAVLMHRKCNRGEHSVPPAVRRRRAAPEPPKPEPPRCAHAPGGLHPGPPPGSCPCAAPLAHHLDIRARERKQDGYAGPSHSVPCPGCGGYTWSRIL